MGLVLYTAAFVAEVVRSGIQSVARRQSRSRAGAGLSKGQEMQKVLLPQALRVIIPPMTNQYLNLTKNSSLAVAIGYPDVVSSQHGLNQTGARGGMHRHHHAGLSHHLVVHLVLHELVQRKVSHQGR